jgi:hypothetical protein
MCPKLRSFEQKPTCFRGFSGDVPNPGTAGNRLSSTITALRRKEYFCEREGYSEVV